jgi:anhydro-N-acetylmuramic acid kinase
MNLDALRRQEQRFVIGLTSGASSSGVKGALVRIKGTGSQIAIKHIETETQPFVSGLRTRMLAPRLDAREISILNFELGERYAEVALKLMEIAERQGEKVDFIASNGHTVSHLPPRGDNAIGTLNIAEPAVIAERTGLPVVSNFRARDMAAGGQGAPLSALAHWLLFHRRDRTVVVLNLGGISGLTVIPPSLDDVISFETGPGCIAIDGAMRLMSAGTKEMDKDGASATKGMVNDEFLDYLLDHPYLSRVPPKSTSRDEFGPDAYLRDAIASRKDYGMDDIVATCTAAVAYSIMRAYNRFVGPRFDVSRLILVGGGIHNKALVSHISKALPSVTMRTSEDYKLPSDAIGCISAAVLGNETICMTPANIPHTTGARRPVILGSITPN